MNYILNQIGMITINITLYYYKYYILIYNINSISKTVYILIGIYTRTIDPPKKNLKQHHILNFCKDNGILKYFQYNDMLK